MSKIWKRPTLVVFCPIGNYLRRYFPKPTGGFLTEKFDVVNNSNEPTNWPAVVDFLRDKRFDGGPIPDHELQDQPEPEAA